MGVSENSSTPKSSILIGFSIINHPIWGTPIFGNTHIGTKWLFPKNGGFPQLAHGFSVLKMIMTWGVKWGYHHLRKHPYRDHGCFFWVFWGIIILYPVKLGITDVILPSYVGDDFINDNKDPY